LLAAYQPSLTVTQLRSTLMSTVDVLPQWNGYVVSNGRLNLARAVASLVPSSNPLPTPTTPPVTNPGPVTGPTPQPTPWPTPTLPAPRPRKITAKADSYKVDYTQSTFTITPGVLMNDRGGNGTLTANLIDAPYWGTVELARTARSPTQPIHATRHCPVTRTRSPTK
jgi:hypothetical protein